MSFPLYKNKNAPQEAEQGACQQAFSLVELSIVLVILGLLVGGIMTGQNLIRAAELRAVSNEFQKYNTAYYSFQDKYLGLPGDLKNATRFWGDQATGTDACPDATIADGTPGTCNGNGDGRIEGDLTESLRAWQHLALAGMVEGNYTGVIAAFNSGQLMPENIVPSKISPAGNWFRYIPNEQFGKVGNHIRFGSYVDASTRYWGGVLTPEEAWSLDVKMDDGGASGGMLIGINGSGQTGCVDGGWGSPANSVNFLLDSEESTCTLVFWLE